MLDAISGEPRLLFVSFLDTAFCGAALKKNSLVLPSRRTSILSPVWSTRGNSTCSLFTSTGSRPNDATHTRPTSLTDSSRCRRDTSLLTILISHALSLRQRMARESERVCGGAGVAVDFDGADSGDDRADFFRGRDPTRDRSRTVRSRRSSFR